MARRGKKEMKRTDSIPKNCKKKSFPWIHNIVHLNTATPKLLVMVCIMMTI